MSKITNKEVEHLEWIARRLVEVHGENHMVDYMEAFNKIISKCKQQALCRPWGIPVHIQAETEPQGLVVGARVEVQMTNQVIVRGILQAKQCEFYCVKGTDSLILFKDFLSIEVMDGEQPLWQ